MMVDIAVIVRGLAGRIESLARELMPAGRKEGAEWRDADAPAGKGSSLYVHTSGAKAGVFSHFAAGVSGDALDLVAYVKFGGDKKQAYHWARAWLGLFDANEGKARAARPSPAQMPPTALASTPSEQEEARRKRQRALSGFLAAQESIVGTAAEWYLRARGIELARLGRQPGCLRFDPACAYPQKLYPPSGHFPALIAAITQPDGTLSGLHCTFLEVHALGRAGKLATVPKAKLVFGQQRGGLVRLWNGTMTSEETGEIKAAPKLGELDARKAGLAARGWHGPALEEMHLAEGIEDGLTLPMERREWRVAAAINIGNMSRVRLPEAIRRVVIWKQNDPATNKAGAAHPTIGAMNKAIWWFRGHGKCVEIATVPKEFKDVNEYWRGVA